MTAIRARFAAVICVFLFTTPALADDKKPVQRAQQPQSAPKSSSSPSLPAEGTNLNRPKGAPAGGSSDSLNLGKSANPTAAPTIGGQAIGGSTAAGANPGATATTAQPASGGTLVDPNANNNPTGGALPKDFSRGAKLQEAVDGGAGALKGDAAKKEASAPGQKSGNAAIEGSKSNFDALRGDQGTRSSQQGYAPTLKPTPTPIVQGDDVGATKGVVSGTVGGATRATTGSLTPITGAEAIVKGVTPKAEAPSPTPIPYPVITDKTRPAEVDPGGKPSKTLEEAKAERSRQTGLPGDDRQQVNRMRADERAASATMAERRGNLINPGEQAPVGGGVATGSKPSNPGAASGRPAGSAVPRKGCPPDNPTC